MQPSPILNVYALPTFVVPSELAGGTAVVIDVLRASTTIVHALDAGALEVIPCVEVADARAIATGLPKESVILGGERGGLLIDGFDLGNSPSDYTPDVVEDKTVVFTTTNGTRAMATAQQAKRVLIGSFVNVSAVAAQLAIEQCNSEPQIHLICAGSDGQIGHDDVLLAGMLVAKIEQLGGSSYRMNAQAVTARETWLHTFALPQTLGAEPIEPRQLATRLCTTEGGRHLISVGCEKDILTASRIDAFSCVPELDVHQRRIRLT